MDLFGFAGNLVLTVVLFALVLGLLVFVHELGHFVAALRMGIAVEEFGFGYPPRARVLFERNGVLYTLNWLPLGGFVRMRGEEGNFAAAGSLASAAPWRKIVVMLAGPLMNLLLAMLIFAGLFMVQGVPVVLPGARVLEVYPDAPAARAGLQVGDTIVEMNGQPVENVDLVAQLASQSQGQPINLLIERAGQRQTLQVTPGPWTDNSGTLRPSGLGIGYNEIRENRPTNPLMALWEAISYSIGLTGQMIGGLALLLGSLLPGGAPVPGGVAGPIGIARGTAEIFELGGVVGLLNWTALLSLNLFLINLLPFPALDGSRIIFALIEWLRRGERIPPEKEALVHAVGFMMLMGLMVLISVSDVANALNGRPVIGGG